MENLIDQDNKVVVPKMVIAIKLPFDLQERILSFPLFHALKDRYPSSEIHFITPKKNIEVLNLLPFTAYYHEYGEDDMRSIFDVHRFCVQAKIYNVDLFISLTNSFVDGCLGFGLRAKKRLGFSDGWKTILFNQKITRPVGHHVSEDFFSLYKAHLGHEFDTKLKVMSRDLTPVVKEWDKFPYLAINLSPIRSAKIDDDWVDLVSRFENQRFIFFASEEQEKMQLLMQNFLDRLPKENSYEFYLYEDWIAMAKMLAYAKGLISYSGPATSLSAYTGGRTLILYDREDPQRFGPFYFLADTSIMTLSMKTEGIMAPRLTFDMEEVALKAFEFFRLGRGN